MKILLVEDESAHAELVRRAFEARSGSFELVVSDTLVNAKKLLAEPGFSLVIADWLLPDGEGMDLVPSSAGEEAVPVVLMSSHGNEHIAVEAMKAGVLDYVVKSESTLADMPHIAEHALREWDNQVRRKRAEEELRHRVAELEAVSRVSSILRAADSLDEMLSRVLDEMLRSLGIEHGAVWLLEPSSGRLRLEQARGWLAGSTGWLARPGAGALGAAFSSGESASCLDFREDEGLPPNFREGLPPGRGGICVPISLASERVGVFMLSAAPQQPFSDGEIRLLKTLSEIVGTGIHRLRLHGHTQRSLKRMAALRTIDLAITSSLGLDLSMDVLLDQAMGQLGADAAVVHRLDPYTQKLEEIGRRGFDYPTGLTMSDPATELWRWEAILTRAPVKHLEALPEGESSQESVRSSGEGFRTYHAIPLVAKATVKGVLEVLHRESFRPDTEWLEFLEALGNLAALAIDNSELFDKLQRSNQELRLAYDSTIEGWSRALDLRDHETEGHTQRVVGMTLRLSRAMGMSQEELLDVKRGALLHDIGKMGIPDQILLKTGPLSEGEWKIMRQHPYLAFKMLAPIPYLRKALDIPYCHHEHWDGSGYPRGFKGQQIPLSARIFSVVDVWDALSSDRPYREAWPFEQVREYILGSAAPQFDPAVVRCFFDLLDADSS